MTGRRHLGWAVVGCGWVGRDLVAPAIEACPDADLVALCDPDPIRLGAAVGTHPQAVGCADVDTVLARPDVDAVYVATPNHTHAAVVVAAAQAGRHVLCEKPMAVTVEEATAMVEACDAAGVRYATAFDQRYHAAHRRVRQLVADGALGVVTLVQVHYACWLGEDWTPWPGRTTDNWRIDPARAGGGAMIDLAPHSIDLVPYLLADEWTDLVAMEQHCVHGYDVPDGAVLVGRLDGGALASISVSYNSPERLPRRRLELHGTRAMAEAIDTMGQTAGGRLTLVGAADGTRADVPIAPEHDRSPFLAQIEAFTEHVLHDVPLPVSPATDVRHVDLLTAATTRRELACP